MARDERILFMIEDLVQALRTLSHERFSFYTKKFSPSDPARFRSTFKLALRKALRTIEQNEDKKVYIHLRCGRRFSDKALAEAHAIEGKCKPTRQQAALERRKARVLKGKKAHHG